MNTQEHEALAKSVFDKLPQEQREDGLYWYVDAEGDDGQGYPTAQAAEEAAEKHFDKLADSWGEGVWNDTYLIKASTAHHATGESFYAYQFPVYFDSEDAKDPTEEWRSDYYRSIL